MVAADSLAEKLPPGLVRRLKRLPRLALALALAAHKHSGLVHQPSTVFMGSGWGALSETCDFLNRLAESQDQFPSPTDFVGSVHNGPAGQVAILCGATGANITVSGGDCSFEQALLAADLLLPAGDGCGLALGADEGHQLLSPLLDPSISPTTGLADGGGGLCLSRNREGAHCCVRTPCIVNCDEAGAIDSLLGALGGARAVQGRTALILAGIPAGARGRAEEQLARFVRQTGHSAPVIRYRELTGEFASASAVAAVMAVSLLVSGQAPGVLLAGRELVFTAEKNSVLVLGLGQGLAAMEFFRP
jgi:3-oxoacyl-(acyl-carrier-protein) synthase